MKVKTDFIPSSVLILNSDNEIIHANECAVKTFGAVKKGTKCFQYTHKNIRPCNECGEICPMYEILNEKVDKFTTLHIHKTLNGNEYNTVILKKISDNLYIELIDDISDIFFNELENNKKQLELIWEMDFLTDIYNRRKIISIINYELKKSKRYKKPLTIIMVDLDGFKNINDGLGHIKGDEVLRAVGVILKENMRDVDYAGRYGGDEFILVLPETNIENSIKIVKRIKKDIETMDCLEDLNVTASFGITSVNENDLTDVDLIKRADEALYKSKHEGKNKYNVK